MKMALLPTGFDVDLLYISTPELDFSIKGKPYHPNVKALNINTGVTANILIRCKEYIAEIYSPVKQKLVPYTGLCKWYPLFFEQQNYEIVIEKKGESDILFWHENVNIRNKVKYVGHSKRVLSGVINFGNDIGFTQIVVKVNGRDYMTVTLEVFPSKIDYQKDYYALLKDVNDELYNLIFDFYKKTYSHAGLKETKGNSMTEFFAIINQVFNKLDSAIGMVLRIPHHALVKEKNIMPQQKIRCINGDTIKWLNKHAHYANKVNGLYIPKKALAIKSVVTYDTFENRFIKYIIWTVINKLNEIKKVYLTGTMMDEEQGKDIAVILRIDEMINKLKKRIESSFLKDVGDIHTINSLSLVFQMAIGYKDVYKYYIMLLKGLMMKEDIFKISIKDLAVLYENWCFIKLNSLLRKRYNLVRQDIIKFANNGLIISLKKGVRSTVEYQNPRNGEKYALVYNKFYKSGDTPTVSQRPDNVLSLEKKGSNIIYHYIFDAKYRINPALEGSDYHKKYLIPGPEEEDINVMHRYRDAIVYENKNNRHFERMVFGAFVLFPYNDEKRYINHHFYKSIDKVNVGGLPFLPGSTWLVEQLLQDIIEGTPQSAFEGTVIQSGIYEYLDYVNFDSREVLIGGLSSVEQLEVNLKHKFYHIPYENVKASGIQFKYVAIFQSKKKFKEEAGIRYYGKVKNWKIVKRKEIKEIPKNSEELYVRFEIEEWQELKNKISCKEFGVTKCMYTNMFLLENATYLPELCIKSKDEYRLYLELKRICSTNAEFHVDVPDKNIKDSTSIRGFEIDGLRIFIDNGRITVYKGDKLVDVISSEEFEKKPLTIIRRIRSY